MQVLNIDQCGDNIARVFAIFFSLADSIFRRTVGPATAIFSPDLPRDLPDRSDGPTAFRGD
jgi:hypothetical protein